MMEQINTELNGLKMDESFENNEANDNKFKRVFMELEEREWDNATRILDRIGDEVNTFPQYWIARLMCKLKVAKEKRLARYEEDFSNDPFYIKAVQCAEGEYREAVLNYCKLGVYLKTVAAFSTSEDTPPKWALDNLYYLDNYKDSREKLNEYCENIYQNIIFYREQLPQSEGYQKMRPEIDKIRQYVNDDIIKELDEYCACTEKIIYTRKQTKQYLSRVIYRKKIPDKKDRQKKDNNLTFSRKIMGWEDFAEEYINLEEYDYGVYCLEKACDCGELSEEAYHQRLVAMGCDLEKLIEEGKSVFFYRGIVYHGLKEYGKARECFEKAYEKGERYADTGMGILYSFVRYKEIHERNIEKAIYYFRKAGRYREDPFSLCYLAGALRLSENPEYESAFKLYNYTLWWSHDGGSELKCSKMLWALEEEKNELHPDIIEALRYCEMSALKWNMNAMERFIKLIFANVEELCEMDEELCEMDEAIYVMHGEMEIWNDLKKLQEDMIGRITFIEPDEELSGYCHLLVKAKIFAEILFEKKRYDTVHCLASFYQNAVAITENIGLYKIDYDMAGKILLEAAETGNLTYIYYYIDAVLNGKATNYKTWEWIIEKVEDMQKEWSSTEEDKKRLLNMKNKAIALSKKRTTRGDKVWKK